MLERLKGYVQNPVFLFILWMGVGLACSLSLMMKGYIAIMLYLASLLACDIFFSFICRISSGTEGFLSVWYFFHCVDFSFCGSSQTVGDDPLVLGELWFPLLCYQQVRFEKVAICCCYISFCK